jgi:hypothetical protein
MFNIPDGGGKVKDEPVKKIKYGLPFFCDLCYDYSSYPGVRVKVVIYPTNSYRGCRVNRTAVEPAQIG